MARTTVVKPEERVTATAAAAKEATAALNVTIRAIVISITTTQRISTTPIPIFSAAGVGAAGVFKPSRRHTAAVSSSPPTAAMVFITTTIISIIVLLVLLVAVRLCHRLNPPRCSRHRAAGAEEG